MKRNFMTRGMALLLAMVLLLAGCATGKPADTTAAPAEETTLPTQEQTTPTENVTDVSVGEITFFSVNLNVDGSDNRYIMAYPNGDGTAYVEFVGDVKKMGNVDESAMEQLATVVAQSGMTALNDQNLYEDGAAAGSAYVEYADGTMLSCSFTGVIPQEYVDAYAALEECAQTLTVDLEVYVPVPVVMGEVDEVAMAELLQILEKTGIKELDTFAISDVAKDDSFAYMMGLSSAEGIAVGTSCDAMMMTTPYSMVIATLEEGMDIETVRADFVANMNWQKWVCVMPTGALVAQKGNMVLCLMGADAMYHQTVQAITDCGWENLEALDCPF